MSDRMSKGGTNRTRMLVIAATVLLTAIAGLTMRLLWQWIVSGHSDPNAARAALLFAVETVYSHLVVGLAAFLGAAFLLIALPIARRWPRSLRRIVIRAAFTGIAILIGMVLSELSAKAYRSWVHRVPRLAMVDGPALASSTDRDATIVVVGESSAEGVPYRDWASVGKMVIWRLRHLFPQRMFHLETQARAGWTLEQMHQKLAESRRRPDAVILYAGHNEFASRYGWSASVPYYHDEPRPSWWTRASNRVAGCSPICGLFQEARGRALVASRPTSLEKVPPRPVVDAPSCTADEYRERIDDFRRRLDAILADLKQAGVLTVVVIPPGNDAGFEPSRSVLPPETPRERRDEFERWILEARAIEQIDPGLGMMAYLDLIARQPGFAETHFRLARLLEQAGAEAAASREYVIARDHDAHPLRCPSALQEIYREAAARHGAILVDGPAAIRASDPHGQLDDCRFDDAMHPSLDGYIVLADAILEALRSRGAFGWIDASPKLEPIDRDECRRHFDVTAATWKEAYRFAAGFYRTAAPIRFDPVERTEKAVRYEAAIGR